MKSLIQALIAPITGLFKQRGERKAAKEAASAKLSQLKQTDEAKALFTDQEWESLSVKGMNDSWKDEYVTVSVVSVFNLIVLGGVLAAFGHIQLLHGIGIAMKALTDAGIDIGFLLEATILAAIGLKVWRA